MGFSYSGIIVVHLHYMNGCSIAKPLAIDHSKTYMLNAKVEAVLLEGSVSPDWEDVYSNIELMICRKG